MRTLLIEISEGSVVRMVKVLDAPKEGIMIIDHDNIEQFEHKKDVAETCFDDFYEVDSIMTFKAIKEEILNEYN